MLETGRYDPVTAAAAPGWARELSGNHTPETEEYGITSVTYRARRPFHPARLMAVLGEWQGLLRSKGFCRIATRPQSVGLWSQAGSIPHCSPTTSWQRARRAGAACRTRSRPGTTSTTTDQQGWEVR